MAKSTKNNNETETETEDFVPHSEDPFLNLAECGLLVGLSRATIARYIDSGALKATRGAGIRRVRRSDLVRLYNASAHADKKPLKEDYGQGNSNGRGASQESD